MIQSDNDRMRAQEIIEIRNENSQIRVDPIKIELVLIFRNTAGPMEHVTMHVRNVKAKKKATKMMRPTKIGWEVPMLFVKPDMNQRVR